MIALSGNSHWHAEIFVKNLNPLKVWEGAIMLRVISDVKGVRYLLNGVARAVHVVEAIFEQSHGISLKYEETA